MKKLTKLEISPGDVIVWKRFEDYAWNGLRISQFISSFCVIVSVDLGLSEWLVIASESGKIVKINAST